MDPTINAPIAAPSAAYSGIADADHKLTIVLGASDNPNRYSFRTLNRLRDKRHPVIAIGRKKVRVADVDIQTEAPALEGVDTVTLYLNRGNQRDYYDYLLSLNPKRIIFNPGAENPELSILAKAQGIEVVNACTLVLLSTGQF
ncbi:MAG: CoA-binding protein [Puia sp.]|nr:CoA-binding protein [Puia sp.]